MSTTYHVNDLSLFRFILLAHWHADEGDVQSHEETISGIVENAWQWAHSALGSSIPPLRISWRVRVIEDVRLAGSTWSREEPIKRLVEARALLDSVYVQLGVQYTGRVRSDDSLGTICRKLRHSLPHLPGDERAAHLLLGITDCCYGEIDPQFDLSESENVVPIMSSSLFESPRPDAEITTIRFPWGLLGIVRAQRPSFVVLIRQEKRCIEIGSWLINFVLPRLALCSHKMRSDWECYDSLRQEIEASARNLARELKGRVIEERPGLSSSSLDYLEERTLTLSNLQDILVEKQARMQEHIISLETNLQNLRIILRDSVLEHEFHRLWTIFGERHAHALHQMRIDRRYFELQKSEASLALTTLGMMIDIERGRTERRLVLILGIVGLVISIVDGFSAELTIGSKVLIVVAGFASALLAWFLRVRRRSSRVHTGTAA